MLPRRNQAENQGKIEFFRDLVLNLTQIRYKWIRIVMNSEGEDLLLKFEMDGRPSNKLNYSVRDGEIVRSRNASKFEGLVLDTTFRIPLNELLSIALPLTKSLQDATNE